MNQSTGERPPRVGRGMTIAGVVVLVVSVVSAAVGTILFGGSVDIESMTRDVAVQRPAVVSVPGEVRFRILEPLRGEEVTMSVAVGFTVLSRDLDCAFTGEDGSVIPARRASGDDSWVDSTMEGDYSPFLVAADLRPGDYVVTCSASGEPSQRHERFTVGRVLTVGEMFDAIGPLLGVVGVLAVSGLIGLLGLVLLVIGLVRSSRARRSSTWRPPGPPPGYGPPSSGPPPPAPPAPPPGAGGPLPPPR